MDKMSNGGWDGPSAAFVGWREREREREGKYFFKQREGQRVRWWAASAPLACEP